MKLYPDLLPRTTGVFLELTKTEELTARWAGRWHCWNQKDSPALPLPMEGARLTAEHAEPQAPLSKRTETEPVTDTHV